MSVKISKWKAASQKSAALMLCLTALITICFVPAMAQQKDISPNDHNQPDRPINISYLA
jgi:hypothetical protein